MQDTFVTKFFTIDGIDCANCAQKMQDRANSKVSDVEVSINFLTQRISVKAPTNLFDEKYKETIQKYLKTGHLKQTQAGYALSNEGFLISTVILAEFI